MSIWKIRYGNEVPPDPRGTESPPRGSGGSPGRKGWSCCLPHNSTHTGASAIPAGEARYSLCGDHPRTSSPRERRAAPRGTPCRPCLHLQQTKELAEEHRRLAGEHQRLAEEYRALCDKEAGMAAQAEKRAGLLADMMTSSTRHLEAHEDAVRTSSQVADSYTRDKTSCRGTLHRWRTSSQVAFLAAGGTLPEIAMVLSYKTPD